MTADSVLDYSGYDFAFYSKCFWICYISTASVQIMLCKCLVLLYPIRSKYGECFGIEVTADVKEIKVGIYI